MNLNEDENSSKAHPPKGMGENPPVPLEKEIGDLSGSLNERITEGSVPLPLEGGERGRRDTGNRI